MNGPLGAALSLGMAGVSAVLLAVAILRWRAADRRSEPADTPSDTPDTRA